MTPSETGRGNTATARRVRHLWPLPPPPAITRGFDAPDDPYGPGHRGVDLAGTPGEHVTASAGGTVAFAGPVAGRDVVSVDHPGGLRTTYEPVTAAVESGENVEPGQRLGQLAAGHPGCPEAACLHWGAREGDEYLDPRSLLGTIRVRLHPV